MVEAPARQHHEAGIGGTRGLIDTGTDKRYVRRDEQGQFKESVDVGRSSATDQRWDAKTTAKKDQGDLGDRQS